MKKSELRNIIRKVIEEIKLKSSSTVKNVNQKVEEDNGSQEEMIPCYNIAGQELLCPSSQGCCAPMGCC